MNNRPTIVSPLVSGTYPISLKSLIDNDIKNYYRKMTTELLEDISEKYNVSLSLLINSWNKVNKEYKISTTESDKIKKESWMIKIPDEEELEEIILEE